MKINTNFFEKKQIWYLTYGIYLPLLSIFLSYNLGHLKLKLIKNSGVKAVLFGSLITLLCYLISICFSYFSFMKIMTHNDILNNSIICGILSAESMIFIGEHTHLELQKILLFLFLYFHNLNL